MALEYQTVKFANDRNGIAEKNVVTDRMARQGWAVSSEAIEQGHFKGDEACCGAMICLPCGLLAGEHRATLWSRTVEKISGVQQYVFCKSCGAVAAGVGDVCEPFGICGCGKERSSGDAAKGFD